MKKLTRRSYFHLLCILLILGSCVLTAFIYRPAFFREIQSIVDICIAFAYYFCTMFYIKHNLKPFIVPFPAQPTTIQDTAMIASNWQNFTVKFKMFWQSLLRIQTHLSYLDKSFIIILVFTQIIVLLIPLSLLFKKIFVTYLTRENNDYNKISRPLKVWNTFSINVYRPVLQWFKDFYAFITANSKIYFKLFIIVWLINLNIVTVLIQCFVILLYFVSSFDFIRLYTQIFELTKDIMITLNTLPWYVLVIILLPILQHIRHRIAMKRLLRHENTNKSFLQETPVVIQNAGAMNCGKTLHSVDFVLSLEFMWRDKALSILQKYDLMFSKFPWINLELEMQKAYAKHIIFNLASIKKWIEKREKDFAKLWQKTNATQPTTEQIAQLKNLLFDYDIVNEPLTYDNKLKQINIFSAIKTYAQAYFIYNSISSLLISNFSIRTDGIQASLGNFPLWDYNYFNRDSKTIDETSRFSHILDWDTLRLGNKFTHKKSNKSLEFGIFTITEIFKDRGNQFETKHLKKDDDRTNQLNDRFITTVKLCRHAATVDNYPFFKIVCDDQRPESGPADLVQLMDVIRISRDKKTGNNFPLFFVDSFFIDMYAYWFSGNYTQYRFSRGDNTLMMTFLHWLASKFNNYNTKITNMYGFTRTELHLFEGIDIEKETMKYHYYLQNKKIFASRYNTACYEKFFNDRAFASGKGLNDLAEYKDVTANTKELNSQHSYMFTDLENSD